LNSISSFKLLFNAYSLTFAAVMATLACVQPPGPAQAQVVANPEPLAPAERKPKPGGIAVVSPVEPLRPPPNAEKIFVTVERVQIDGAFLELETQTNALKREIEGRRVSVAQIYKFANELQQAYFTAGYPLARIKIEPNPRPGEARLAVIDGFIERLDLTQVPELERELVRVRLQPLVGRGRLTTAEIERRLMLLGDINGLQGAGSTKPSASPGRNILVVGAVENHVAAVSSVDNLLPRQLGTWRFSQAFLLNNAFGWGEQFRADVASGREFDRFLGGNSKFQSYGGLFSLPLGADGLNVTTAYVSVRQYPSVPSGTFITDQEQVNSKFDRAYLRLNYPIFLTLANAVRAQIGVEHIDFRTEAGPFPAILYFPIGTIYDFNRDRYAFVRLAGEWDTRFPWAWGGNASTAIFYERGLGGRTGTLFSPVPLSRPGTSPTFDKLKLDVRAAQPLPEDFALALFFKAQTGFGQPLMLPEQLPLSGPDAASGFALGTLNVDRGLVGRVELSHPLNLGISQFPNAVSPYVFAAAGRGVLEQPYFELPYFLGTRVISAESLGGGVRGSASLFGAPFQEQLSLEFAKSFSNVPFQRSGYRTNLIYSMAFAGSPPLADLPWSDRVRRAPVPFWNGLYAGLNSGYSFGGSSTTSMTAVPVATGLDNAVSGAPYSAASALSASGTAGAAASGFLGGGQVGLNFRFDRVVFGLEQDVQGAGLSGRSGALGIGGVRIGDASNTVLTATANEKAVNWLTTTRGRAGYLVTPTLLAYGTAGLAVGGVATHSVTTQAWTGNSIVAPLLVSPGAASSTRGTLAGWTAGAGLEWTIAPNVTAKAEYLYFDLGALNNAPGLLQTTLPFFDSNAVATTSRTTFNGHILRAGMNYHFNTFEDSPETARPLIAKSGPIAPIVPRWNGFFAGLNSGYAWNVSPGVSTFGFPLADGFAQLGFGPVAGASALSVAGASNAAAKGFLGGGQVGYNMEVQEFLLGLEGDVDGAGFRDRAASFGSVPDFTLLDTLVVSGAESEKSLDWLATARGRLGYFANPCVVAYATAGLAVGGVGARSVFTQQWTGLGANLVSSGAVGAYSNTRAGWTAGAGLEWLFLPSVSLKAEYMYYDLGQAQFAATPLVTGFGAAAVVLPASRTRFNGQIARMGLNYHFDIFR
jgi:hemolysin activation/secretion protein/opacity protein-like surface antigen